MCEVSGWSIYVYKPRSGEKTVDLKEMMSTEKTVEKRFFIKKGHGVVTKKNHNGAWAFGEQFSHSLWIRVKPNLTHPPPPPPLALRLEGGRVWAPGGRKGMPAPASQSSFTHKKREPCGAVNRALL